MKFYSKSYGHRTNSVSDISICCTFLDVFHDYHLPSCTPLSHGVFKNRCHPVTLYIRYHDNISNLRRTELQYFHIITSTYIHDQFFINITWCKRDFTSFICFSTAFLSIHTEQSVSYRPLPVQNAFNTFFLSCRLSPYPPDYANLIRSPFRRFKALYIPLDGVGMQKCSMLLLHLPQLQILVLSSIVRPKSQLPLLSVRWSLSCFYSPLFSLKHTYHHCIWQAILDEILILITIRSSSPMPSIVSKSNPKLCSTSTKGYKSLNTDQ